MGLFDKVFKNNRKNEEPAAEKDSPAAGAGNAAPDEKYISELKEYTKQFIPGPIDELSTQREMFGMAKAVLHVDESMLDMKVYSAFKKDSPGDLTILQLSALTAYDINRWIGAFNKNTMLSRIHQQDTETLLRCLCAMTFYCSILKDEYKANLNEYETIIVTEVYNRGFKVPASEDNSPVRFADGNIYIDSRKFAMWLRANPGVPCCEVNGVLPLTEKTPTISLYDDRKKTRDYCLQTEGDEDFTGKYFQIGVRLSFQGNPAVPVAQIDGFVSDTPENRTMTRDDVGYRMEGYFLASSGNVGKQQYEMNRGQDLPAKALKYTGYTTPSNVRLIGICPDCGKSFAFHGYAFYMGQEDVAYSDDGLDCCTISAYEFDKDTWVGEAEGKTFRYYNSFNCPHCGAPYIDYKKFPGNKVFGVSGCVHLGRKIYRA